MMLKLKNKYVNTIRRLKIPHTAKEDIIGIYSECLCIWNRDFDNIVKVKVDSVSVSRVQVKKQGNESEEHALLKYHGANWLRAKGYKDIVFEKGYPGGVSDVCCSRRKIAIECGYLSTEDKIISAVKHGWTVCLLPYRSLHALAHVKNLISNHHILIFNAKNGCKLDSLFRFATEKEIDKMYNDRIKMFTQLLKDRKPAKFDLNKTKEWAATLYSL